MCSLAPSTIARRIQRGFTLVELLIVVIILAVLSSIVIPQFSSSTTEAKEAALTANLTVMRSAIELYKAQHGGKNPGEELATKTDCGTNLSFSGDAIANSDAAMIRQLTGYTNLAGLACEQQAVGASFGKSAVHEIGVSGWTLKQTRGFLSTLPTFTSVAGDRC